MENYGVIVFAHWGNVPNGILEPSRIGTGVKGVDQEYARVIGLTYASAVVFGSEYHEPVVQSRTLYVGALIETLVYDATDWRNDSWYRLALDEVYAQHGNNVGVALAKYQAASRDRGFHAMRFGNQLRIFVPTPVIATTKGA